MRSRPEGGPHKEAQTNRSTKKSPPAYEKAREKVHPKFTWRTPGFEQSDDRPVVLVTSKEAVAFCEWLSERENLVCRLPTATQWEYACRAGPTSCFCIGTQDEEDMLGEYAWYSGNSWGKTHPVGSKKPNAWGLFDMHGHVWEYCFDAYAGRIDNHPDRPRSETKRPNLLASQYVRRGGSFRGTPVMCRSAQRNSSGFTYSKTEAGAGSQPPIVCSR